MANVEGSLENQGLMIMEDNNETGQTEEKMLEKEGSGERGRAAWRTGSCPVAGEPRSPVPTPGGQSWLEQWSPIPLLPQLCGCRSHREPVIANGMALGLSID